MKPLAAFAFALVAALPAFPAAAQPAVLHAKQSTRSVAPGALEAELRALKAGEAHWVAWEVPSAEKGHVCCYSSFHGGEIGGLCCGGCRLESETAFTSRSSGSGAIPLETSRLHVFLRMEAGRATTVRAFSGDCAIDAEGRALVWLTGVVPEESVRHLAALAAGPWGDEDDDGLADRALSALALHASPEADRVLTTFVASGRPFELRKKAAFWLGNSRGRAGFEALRAVVADDPDADFRHHGTFALSQSPVPEATALLLRMARRDPEADVRGQALFWLAQKAGEKAASAIVDAIHDDPDAEVKEKAVFALSQLPRERAVTELIRVARTSRIPEVREKALFWLGETKDPRALEYIEEILKR